MAGVAGKSGRKRKPRNLKIIDGTFRPERDGDRDAPVIRPAAGAKCPDWLDAEAKKFWRELSPELERMNLLAAIDGPAFTTLVLLMSELKWTCSKANKKLRVTTSATGVKKMHPVNGYRIQLIERLRSVCSEFGMTPAGFARVEAIVLGGERSRGITPLPIAKATGTNGKEKTQVTDRKGNVI